MTDPNLGKLGADHEAAHALDVIIREGRRDPEDKMVRLALDYLHALIPVNTEGRTLLLVLTDHLASYGCGLWSGTSGITEFDPVVNVAHMLRYWMDWGGLPRIARPRTAAELAAVAERLGVRSDWHEPDEQRVSARVITKAARPHLAATDGSLDNAGSSLLEQTVLVYQDHLPVAEVPLATLFALACDAGRPDLTPPAAGDPVAEDGDNVATRAA